MRRQFFAFVLGAAAVACGLGLLRSPAIVSADGDASRRADCRGLPNAAALKKLLMSAPGAGGMVGGLFNGTRMWGAVVNRDGELCAYATSTANPRDVWPGSQAIAKTKAYTANAFSLDDFVLSTARLYTFTQPGHSLWSLGHANLHDASQLLPPGGPRVDLGRITGGMIFFGGGVPLYRDGRIIGGLGVSGDTSCADHEVAKRVRDLGGLNPPGGSTADDIVYTVPDGPSVFAHPLCLNTYRNGVALGDEAPGTGY